MDVLAAYVTHRHAILFYSLLATLVLSPVFAMFEVRGVALQAVLATNVLAAVLGFEPGPRRSVLVVLTMVIVAVGLAPSSIVDESWSGAAFGLFAAVGLVCAAESVRFVMRARSVDAEHVYAALSVYLLAGTFFGIAHWSVEQAWPGSYVENGQPGSILVLSDAIYFSFVTIASLGYGDILPVSDVARGLATLEAVGGQLYLAALVARLIGAWMR
jgi:voltage-gated potassium channel